MTDEPDKLVEAVARAIKSAYDAQMQQEADASDGALDFQPGPWQEWECEAASAIAAARPMIEHQARDAERDSIVAYLRKENELCDCFAREETECACGAWDGNKSVYLAPLADAIAAGEHRP